MPEGVLREGVDVDGDRLSTPDLTGLLGAADGLSSQCSSASANAWTSPRVTKPSGLPANKRNGRRGRRAGCAAARQPELDEFLVR